MHRTARSRSGKQVGELARGVGARRSRYDSRRLGEDGVGENDGSAPRAAIPAARRGRADRVSTRVAASVVQNPYWNGIRTGTESVLERNPYWNGIRTGTGSLVGVAPLRGFSKLSRAA